MPATRRCGPLWHQRTRLRTEWHLQLLHLCRRSSGSTPSKCMTFPQYFVFLIPHPSLNSVVAFSRTTSRSPSSCTWPSMMSTNRSAHTLPRPTCQFMLAEKYVSHKHRSYLQRVQVEAPIEFVQRYPASDYNSTTIDRRIYNAMVCPYLERADDDGHFIIFSRLSTRVSSSTFVSHFLILASAIPSTALRTRSLVT